MEEWKEIKSIRTQIGTNIKWYLSNKGRVKLIAYYKGCQLDEEILSLGHCVYIHKEELHVYMIGGAIYRTIYRLFVEDIPKGYQIHHKDYNHYNNDVDNLECLSASEHGSRHGFCGLRAWYNSEDIDDNRNAIYEKSKNKINELQSKYANYTKEDAANDLKLIYNRFDDKCKEYRIEQKRIELELKEQQKIEARQKFIEDRLATGNYILEDGKLKQIHMPKWTEERRRKTQQTRENSEAWKNRGDKIRDTLKDFFSEPENRKKQLEQLAYIREIRLNNLK